MAARERVEHGVTPVRYRYGAVAGARWQAHPEHRHDWWQFSVSGSGWI